MVTDMTFQYQDPITNEWRELTGVTELAPVPQLEPGYLFSQPVPQVRPSVYEIPDELLFQAGWGDIQGLGRALQEAMRLSPEGTAITVSRDSMRNVTVVEVIIGQGN